MIELSSQVSDLSHCFQLASFQVSTVVWAPCPTAFPLRGSTRSRIEPCKPPSGNDGRTTTSAFAFARREVAALHDGKDMIAETLILQAWNAGPAQSDR